MPSKKKNRKAYEGEKPDPPDPGYEGARFLGWIKKHGFMYEFCNCENYCNSIGLDIEDFIKKMGYAHIIFGKTGRGEVLVRIVDRKWASKWAREYKTDNPHYHGAISLSTDEEQ